MRSTYYVTIPVHCGAIITVEGESGLTHEELMKSIDFETIYNQDSMFETRKDEAQVVFDCFETHSDEIYFDEEPND